MSAQHEETQHLKIVFLADLTNSKEIAQRFAHLCLAVDTWQTKTCLISRN